MNPKNRSKSTYADSPLIEALCELRFVQSKWDATIPGVFYDRVKDRFPVRETLHQAQAKINAEKTGDLTAQISSEPRIRFLDENRTRALQLGKDLLIVNHLRPYTEFEDWEPLIYEMAHLYVELTESRGINLVSLRYLDKFELPGEFVKMEDYFHVYPNLPINMAQSHGGFMTRFEMTGEGNHGLLITFGHGGARADGIQEFTLDILDQYRSDEPIGLDDLAPIVRQAHDNSYRAFEGSITDKMKEICGKVVA